MNVVNENVSLAQYTSLNSGGPADELLTVDNSHELLEYLQSTSSTDQITVLGYGTNSLISDEGIRGMTVVARGGDLHLEDDGTLLVADAGVWWDDVVRFAVDAGLWGTELMSGIPGAVGAAVVGNIAAYGQSVADSVESVKVYDRKIGSTIHLSDAGLEFQYRSSILPSKPEMIVLSASFRLSRMRHYELSYESALVYAKEHKMSFDTLEQSRALILAVRSSFGALYDWRMHDTEEHTAGSFFKNPLVSKEKALQIMSFDESGKSLAAIKAANQTHGGSVNRVSAAHVLLAAGYRRGQSWGDVRLHPSSVLKIENTGAAITQDIMNVALEIQQTVKEKLDVLLEPEVKYLQ